MNQTKSIGYYFKKHWLDLLFIAVIALLIFHPDAKPWVLRQLFSVGLFKADIDDSSTSTEAYQLNFVDPQGKALNTADLRGKIVFINFWATWCPPCRAEMPSIQSLYNKFKDDDRFVFIMADADNNLPASSKYLAAQNFLLPLYAIGGEVPQSLYDGSLPTTIVLGKNGELLFQHEGVANYNSAQFIEKLKALAAK